MPAVAIANPQVARFLSPETCLVSFNRCFHAATHSLSAQQSDDIPIEHRSATNLFAVSRGSLKLGAAEVGSSLAVRLAL
jgi:hypothetical protein